MPLKPHSYFLPFDTLAPVAGTNGGLATETRRVPFDGFIKRLKISFRGTGYLVNVRLFLGAHNALDQIIPGPDETFMNFASDDIDWPISIPVKGGQDIMVEWRNTDENVANRVPLLLLIEPNEE